MLMLFFAIYRLLSSGWTHSNVCVRLDAVRLDASLELVRPSFG